MKTLAMAQQAMIQKLVPVIRSEYNQGLFRKPESLQLIYELPDTVVGGLDTRVVQI